MSTLALVKKFAMLVLPFLLLSLVSASKRTRDHGDAACHVCPTPVMFESLLPEVNRLIVDHLLQSSPAEWAQVALINRQMSILTFKRVCLHPLDNKLLNSHAWQAFVRRFVSFLENLPCEREAVKAACRNSALRVLFKAHYAKALMHAWHLVPDAAKEQAVGLFWHLFDLETRLDLCLGIAKRTRPFNVLSIADLNGFYSQAPENVDCLELLAGRYASDQRTIVQRLLVEVMDGLHAADFAQVVRFVSVLRALAHRRFEFGGIAFSRARKKDRLITCMAVVKLGLDNQRQPECPAVVSTLLKFLHDSAYFRPTPAFSALLDGLCVKTEADDLRILAFGDDHCMAWLKSAVAEILAKHRPSSGA